MSGSDPNLQREIVAYLKIWKKVKKAKVIRYIMKRLKVSNNEARIILRVCSSIIGLVFPFSLLIESSLFRPMIRLSPRFLAEMSRWICPL